MEEQHTEIFQDFLAWSDSPCYMEYYDSTSSQLGWESSYFNDLQWLSQWKPKVSNPSLTDGYEYSYGANSIRQVSHQNLFIYSSLRKKDSSPSYDDIRQSSDTIHSPRYISKETYNLSNRDLCSQLNNNSIQNLSIHSSSTPTITRSDICKLVKQRHGCQLLLHQLQLGSSLASQEIMETCCLHFGIWMKHPIANFLCQQVWKCLSEQQRMDILQRHWDILPKAALHTYGTRVVQVMISSCGEEENENRNVCISYLQSILSSVAKFLFKDVNGAHVIQHCFLYWSSEDNQFLYHTIQENFLELATHRQGCCMIQTSMDFACSSQLDDIATNIIQHIFVLIHDAFGNYVVQHILDSKNPRYIHDIMKKLQGHCYSTLGNDRGACPRMFQHSCFSTSKDTTERMH
ncbi:Pumilio domain-containing protein C6G9.14 [Galdieria sulphuraria]|nr:Pumilio domain-containing protein C6G9.14 [Galdieria sulphuraria]